MEIPIPRKTVLYRDRAQGIVRHDGIDDDILLAHQHISFQYMEFLELI